MLCLGRLLLKAETIINSFLLNFFISPSVSLPGAHSVPPWANPWALICAGWMRWATWARSLTSALTCLFLVRDTAKLSYVTVLLGGNSAH